MERRTWFLLVITVVTWTGSHACFSSSSDEVNIQMTGSGYYRECECTQPGYAVKNLQWLDDNGKPIGPKRPGTNPTMFTMVNESCCLVLHIPAVTRNTSGVYKCVYKGQPYNQSVSLYAQYPITLMSPKTQYLVLKNRSLIKCEVHADPEVQPRVVWYREVKNTSSYIEIEGNEKYDIVPEGLYVNDVQWEDNGIYNCTAMDIKTGDYVSNDVRVEILTKPVIKYFNGSKGNEVNVTEQLVIKCKADGDPKPIYVFEKFGNSTNSSRWQRVNNSIVIEKAMLEDKGIYQCRAESDAGVAYANVTIDVLVPPKVTSFKNITVTEGTEVTLDCQVEGNPPPTISVIFKGENDTHESKEIKILENLTFKAYGVDNGRYICNVTNKAGSDNRSMYLSVEYKPSFDMPIETVWGWQGKAVNLSCACDSKPRAQVTWGYRNYPGSLEIDTKKLINKLNNRNKTHISFMVPSSSYPYGIYVCKANNSQGSSMKTIEFKEGRAPPMVPKASLYSMSYTSATFSIDEPYPVDGPEIQGYTAEYDTEENYNVTHIHINRTWSIDRPYTVDELDSDTMYLIRFAAINEVGKGPWTELHAFRMPEPSFPNAPVWESETDIVNVTSMDQEVKWSPAETNGAAIQYYTLNYCLADEFECYDVKVAANEELKIDNNILEVNRTYFINITAHNFVGDSPPANLTIVMLAEPLETSILSPGALIGISAVIVLIFILLLDLILCLWKKQGMIASCCIKKKSKTDEKQQNRDKKGLLKDNRQADESLKSPDNRHKEFEYNKTTGIITGRHSAV